MRTESEAAKSIHFVPEAGGWLDDPKLIEESGQRRPDMVTAVTADGDELRYRWHTDGALITLVVRGYQILGRHPHKSQFAVRRLGEVSRDVRLAPTHPAKPRRTIIFDDHGLTADVARMAGLLRRAKALLGSKTVV